MSLAVSGEAENADRGPVSRLKHGQCSRDLVGAIRSNEKVDFVDIDEFGIDRRFICWRCLIIVVNQLDWTPKQPPFLIHIVTPDLKRDEKLLSIRPVGAGHPHAEAHFYRVSRPC